jgi:hypothetical protein
VAPLYKHKKFGTHRGAYRTLNIPYNESLEEELFISKTKARCPICYLVGGIDKCPMPLSKLLSIDIDILVTCTFCNHNFVIKVESELMISPPIERITCSS